MKYLIATDGTWGDILPFSSVAQELQRNGHEVVFLTNGYYEDFITSKGLRFVQTTTKQNRQDLLSHKNLWNPYKGLMVLNKATKILFEASFDPILREARGCDAIISHSLMYAAKTVAEHLGVQHIGLLFSPIQVRSTISLPTLPGGHNPNGSRLSQYFFYKFADNVLFDPFVSGPVNKKRKELGLKKASGLIQWGASDTVNVGLWPEWYKKTEADQSSLTTVGFPKSIEFVHDEDDAIMEWVHNGTPPIIATLGSGNMFAGKLLEKIRAITAMSDERFMFIQPGSDSATVFDPQLVITGKLKLSSVLPLSKLFIHHGGAGSVAQAVVTGTPQIIMPLSHDQPDNAGHIIRNKLGTAVWNKNISPEKLLEVLTDVTNSSEILQSCKTAKERIAQDEDGVVMAARVIAEKTRKI